MSGLGSASAHRGATETIPTDTSGSEVYMDGQTGDPDDDHDEEESFFVRALYDFSGADTASLSFKRGALIEVLTTLESGWWDGVLVEQRERGWFPSNYVSRVTDEEALWAQGLLDRDTQAMESLSLATDRQQNASGQGVPSSVESSVVGDYTPVDARDDAGDDIFAELAQAAFQARTSSSIARQQPSQANSTRPVSVATSAGSGRHTPSSASAWDYWVPQVTQSGQVVYYNTRTGETSLDMPAGADERSEFGDSRRGSVAPGSMDTTLVASTRQQSMTSTVVTKASDTKSLSSNSFVSRYPESALANTAWVARTLQDGSTYFYENLQTGEKRWTPPSAEEASLSVLSPGNAAADDAKTSTAPTSRDTITLDSFRLPTSVGAPAPTLAIDRSSTPSRQAARSQLSHRRLSSVIDLDTLSAPPMGKNAARVAIALRKVSLPRPVTIGLLEQDVRRAISQLVDCAHPNRSRERDRANVDAAETEDRQALASAIVAVVARVSVLLHAAGVLDTATPSNALYAGALNLDYEASTNLIVNELRPFARKITSTLSKLILAVRATWGLMASSNQEDDAFVASFQLAEDEEELQVLRRTRNDATRLRQEIESKLRLDVVVGTRDATSSLGAFVAEFVKLRSATGLQSYRASLPALKLVEPVIFTTAEALLLPGGSIGANWRGHGFAVLPLESASVLALNPLSTLVTGKVTEAKSTVLKCILGLRQSLEALSAGTRPISTSTKGRPATPPNSRARSRSRAITLFPALLEQSQGLMLLISRFLSATEEIDIAACVDIEIDIDNVPGLRESLDASVSAGPSKSKATPDQYKGYNASLKEGKQLLLSLQTSKQSIYDANASLLLSVQSLGIRQSRNRRRQIGLDVGANNISQPAETSPLQSFTAPSPAVEDMDAAFSALLDAEDSIESLSRALSALLKVAELQATMPSDLRQINAAYRRLLVDRASARMQPKSANMAFSLSATREPVQDGLSPEQVSAQTFSHEPATPARTTDAASWAPSMNTKSKLRKMFGDDAPPPEAQRTLGVRPTGPAFLQPDYAPGDLSLASDGQVKGGTLAALVEKLTSHEGVDHHFNTTFLLTYRTFTTSNDLFDMLVQRYMIEMPAGLAAEEAHIWTEQKQKLVRIRVLNILKVWIESNLYDDNESAVLDRVSRFATEAVTDSVAAKQVIRVVERRLQNGVPSLAAPLTSYGPPPPPIISRSIRKLKFLDMDPTELARQLTLYDSRLFSAIRPPECLAKAWPKKVQTDSPNIRAMIDLSNAITRWVGCTILEYQDPKKRVGVVKHFVNIAERCRQLQNFSTVMHIIAGLNSTPIYRLKRTWEIVPQKTVNTLAALNELMKPNKNFGDYRDAVRTIGPPCVPFLGVYLTDWTFIGDGNPDFLREKPDQINFAKRQKAGELIQQVQLHQSTPYNLQEVPSFLKYLEEQFNLADRDEQELYELSMALEPRERDDERVARMLNESGFI